MKKITRDEPITSGLFERIDYLCGLLVLFVSFGVYLSTLTPTVGFHDSGELIIVAYTLTKSPSTRVSSLYSAW